MKTDCKTASYTTFLITLLVSLPVTASASEVDFSCVKEQVRSIIQVTDGNFGNLRTNFFDHSRTFQTRCGRQTRQGIQPGAVINVDKVEPYGLLTQ